MRDSMSPDGPHAEKLAAWEAQGIPPRNEVAPSRPLERLLARKRVELQAREIDVATLRDELADLERAQAALEALETVRRAL